MKRKARHTAHDTVLAGHTIEAALQDAEQHEHGHQPKPDRSGRLASSRR